MVPQCSGTGTGAWRRDAETVLSCGTPWIPFGWNLATEDPGNDVGRENSPRRTPVDSKKEIPECPFFFFFLFLQDKFNFR